MFNTLTSSILSFFSGIAERCSYAWQPWARWTYPIVKKFTEWLTRYGLLPMKSLDEMFEMRTSEKVYQWNNSGRFLKRSLKPNEYTILHNGDPYIPLLVIERLQNEAACMRFIRENTDIPVPKILDTYEENGSYFLWMEYINGIEMSELSKEEQAEVIPQGQYLVKILSPFYFKD